MKDLGARSTPEVHTAVKSSMNRWQPPKTIGILSISIFDYMHNIKMIYEKLQPVERKQTPTTGICLPPENG